MFQWLAGKVAAGAVSGTVGVIMDGVANVISKLYTTDGERLDKQTALERLRQEPLMNQLAINLAEAQSGNWFVAGWRPFVGWICGLALAWTFIGREFLLWGVAIAGMDIPAPPVLDIEYLLSVLMGMLGLAVTRSAEKFKGVA
jgi:hypothetical protein